MSAERTLLERLRVPDEVRKAAWDESAARASVLRNLLLIFNTPQGQVPIRPDYGMPHMTELAVAFPDSLERVRRSILEGIKKYEPRLAEPRVRHVEDDDGASGTSLPVLRFEITARLVGPGERSGVHFESIVDSSGRVRIRG
jgi:type VI secretion system protein